MMVMIMFMFCLGFFLLIVFCWLRASYQYRWRDGYDSDLENDYRSMLQYNQRK